MKNILAIGGSNSTNSINRILAHYTASLFNESLVKSYDLSSIELPVYSVQLEEQLGIPEVVIAFATQIDQSDLIVVSLAEHNGFLSAGFKNLLDWTSRVKGRKTFGDKPMFLMATTNEMVSEQPPGFVTDKCTMPVPILPHNTSMVFVFCPVPKTPPVLLQA